MNQAQSTRRKMSGRKEQETESIKLKQKLVKSKLGTFFSQIETIEKLGKKLVKLRGKIKKLPRNNLARKYVHLCEH